LPLVHINLHETVKHILLFLRSDSRLRLRAKANDKAVSNRCIAMDKVTLIVFAR